MAHHHRGPITQALVEQEIQRVVARAAKASGFLRAGEHAYRLSKAYPDSGMSGAELVNAIIAEAAAAGVAVEVNQPVSAPT